MSEKKESDFVVGFILLLVLLALVSEAPVKAVKATQRSLMFVKVHLADALIVPILGSIAWYWGGKAVGPALWMSFIGYGVGRFSQWIQGPSR